MLYCGSKDHANPCSSDSHNRYAGDAFQAHENLRHKLAACPDTHAERRRPPGSPYSRGKWGNSDPVYEKRACVPKGSEYDCCAPATTEDGYINLGTSGVKDCTKYRDNPALCDNALKKMCNDHEWKTYEGKALMDRVWGTSGIAKRCYDWCNKRASEGRTDCDAARTKYCQQPKNRTKKRCACMLRRWISRDTSKNARTEELMKNFPSHCYLDSCLPLS